VFIVNSTREATTESGSGDDRFGTGDDDGISGNGLW
jgi:hypothetical protein